VGLGQLRSVLPSNSPLFSFAFLIPSGAIKIDIHQMFETAHLQQFVLVLSANDGATQILANGVIEQTSMCKIQFSQLVSLVSPGMSEAM
jgi:hypothetical protein